MFWIEFSPCRDEYADIRGHRDTIGIFLSSGFCVAGLHYANWGDAGWRFGLVLFNIGFGVWSDGK